MTAAALNMPGQGRENAQLKFKELNASLRDAFFPYDARSVHSAEVGAKPKETETDVVERERILQRAMNAIAQAFKAILNFLRNFFGLGEEKEKKKEEEARRGEKNEAGASKQGEPEKENETLAQSPLPIPNLSANDGKFQKDGTPVKAMLSEGSTGPIPTQFASNLAANDIPHPVGAAPGITNDWVVEDGDRPKKSVSPKPEDVTDAIFQELDETPLKLTTPTYLLPGNASEADLAADVVATLSESVTRQLQDPNMVAKLREAANMDDEAEAEKVMTKLLLGPTFGDVEKENEALRTSLASQIKDVLKEDSVDESLAEVTAQSLVEGLPTNMAPEMLSPDQAERITSLLQGRASDIEKLTALNAMLGARPAIFDGTFDWLKQRPAGDTSVFDKSSFKLSGKQTQEDAFEEFKQSSAARPRI